MRNLVTNVLQHQQFTMFLLRQSDFKCPDNYNCSLNRVEELGKSSLPLLWTAAKEPPFFRELLPLPHGSQNHQWVGDFFLRGDLRLATIFKVLILHKEK